MQEVSILFKSGREVRIQAELDKLFEIMDQGIKAANDANAKMSSITFPGQLFLSITDIDCILPTPNVVGAKKKK